MDGFKMSTRSLRSSVLDFTRNLPQVWISVCEWQMKLQYPRSCIDLTNQVPESLLNVLALTSRSRSRFEYH